MTVISSTEWHRKSEQEHEHKGTLRELLELSVLLQQLGETE